MTPRAHLPPTVPPGGRPSDTPATVPADAAATPAGKTLFALAALLVVAGVTALAALALSAGRPGSGRALSIAAVACLPGFLIGRCLVGNAPTDPGRALVGALAVIALRTVLPLAVLGWLTTRPAAPGGPAAGPPPVDAAGTLVAFYLALLATDVVLHVIAAPRGRRGH